MRGGAQAHLIECSDGNQYVVKFRENPQGRRVLVNELISAVLLRQMGVSTPEVATVIVDDDFLARNPECWIGDEDQKIPIGNGCHFGSRYPVTSGNTPVFDMLPDTHLPNIANRDDFLGALLFDKWASTAGSRQAVFCRADSTSGVKRPRWVALMIDNGHAFEGNQWTLGDSFVAGVYHRSGVYGSELSLADFAPWIAAVRRISKEFVTGLIDIVPPEWIAGDERQLMNLLRQLAARSQSLPALLIPTIDYINRLAARSAGPTLHAWAFRTASISLISAL